MRLTNIFILLFLMSAFAVGVSLKDTDYNILDTKLNDLKYNSSFDLSKRNLTIDSGSNYTNGIITVVYDGCDFLFKGSIEIMRLGIRFGYENPDYFTPEYIFKIILLVIIVIIVSYLIQPLIYIVAFIVIGVMWIIDKHKKKKKHVKR